MVNIRSEEEIKKIAFSCQIVADTLIMLEEFIKPGQSILELDKKAENFILSKGARPAFKGYMGFPFYFMCFCRSCCCTWDTFSNSLRGRTDCWN